MKLHRRAIAIAGSLVAIFALAFPPVFFHYYEGPRTYVTEEGLHALWMKHGIEEVIEYSAFPAGIDPTLKERARTGLHEAPDDAPQMV